MLKMLSVLLASLILIASVSAQATLPVAKENYPIAEANLGTFSFVGYVVGHGPNLDRAAKDADSKMWTMIFDAIASTGLELVDLEILEEGPIGSTMYFIEFSVTLG